MTTRASFLGTTLAACSLPSFPKTLAKPKMLRKGDLVGLVAPASPLAPGEVEQGVAHMRSLGLRVRLGTHVHAQNGYLAGSDAERAGDFNHMAREPKVRAIVALRGGYGTMRILENIDYAALRRDPKIILGFSDVTALLNAIALRSGIVTFHGPLAVRDTTYDTITHERIARALMQPEPIGTLRASADALSSETAQTITGGRARGKLAGGNLSIVASLEGTPYAIAARNVLLFLEETQEEDYRIDRMLTQLRLAGTFAAANGIAFGQCTECVGAESVLRERLADLGYPVTAGFPIGHIGHQWILPIGIEAELDATNKTLTVLESGVSVGSE